MVNNSAHPRLVILVGKLPEGFNSPVNVLENDGWMADAVEHVGLDRCVVVHVLEGEAVTSLELILKTPVSHIVATQARVATYAISGTRMINVRQRLCDDWLVGHL